MFLFLIFIIAQTKMRRLQLGTQSDETVKINVAYAFEGILEIMLSKTAIQNICKKSLIHLFFIRISIYFGLCYYHVPYKWTTKIRMVVNVRLMHLWRWMLGIIVLIFTLAIHDLWQKGAESFLKAVLLQHLSFLLLRPQENSCMPFVRCSLQWQSCCFSGFNMVEI